MFSSQSKLTSGLFFAMIQLFLACNNHSNADLKAYWLLNKEMTNSVEFLSMSNYKLYRQLDERLKDPASYYVTRQWQPKAMYAQHYSDGMVAYIDSLKYEIIQEAGVKNKLELDSLKGMNLSHASVIFFENYNILNDKLRKYMNDVFNTDSIENEYSRANFLKMKASIELENRFEGLQKELILKIPAIGAIALLSECQYNVRQVEYDVVNFHFQNTCVMPMIFDKFQVIVLSNSTAYLPGDKIEVIAGIGAFSAAAKPKIFINGKPVEIGADATAVYSTLAPDKEGKYVIPVRIKYHDNTGELKELSKKVVYQVLKNSAKSE